MARSAVRARRWSLTTASFAADLALYIVLSLTIWLVLPALFLGWTPVMVSSGSMSPAINPGDLVLLDTDVPEDEWYVPGTIVTFEDRVREGDAGEEARADGDRDERDETRLVTHRVDRIETAGAYITRGDANPAADPRPVEPQQVVGSARLLIPWLGLPVHWGRSGQFLNLAALVAGLLACVAITTREVAVSRLHAAERDAEGTSEETGEETGEGTAADEQADEAARRRSIDAGATRPIDDVGALGARAARAARAAGKGALATQDARDQQRRDEQQRGQPDRRDTQIPPASAMLLVVALTGGFWASAAASPSQAAFASTTGSTGNTFAMATTPELSVGVDITSDWGDGYCADVSVSTTSASPVVWEVELDLSTFPVNGTIDSASNATIEQVGTSVTATGAGWNNTVVVDSPRAWQFCATRPPPPIETAEYELEIYEEWGSGYCATVTVTTPSPTPITWQVAIDLADFPLNGTPTNTWSATTAFDGTTLTASGQDWNAVVVAGSSTQWGFCATRSGDEIPLTSFVLPVTNTTEVSQSTGGQIATSTFSIELTDELYLAGPATAELRTRRVNPNGNAERSITISLQADGAPLATGAVSFGPGDAGWFTSTVTLGPTTTGSLPAGTEITVELAAVRMVLDEGNASRLVIAGG